MLPAQVHNWTLKLFGNWDVYVRFAEMHARQWTYTKAGVSVNLVVLGTDPNGGNGTNSFCLLVTITTTAVNEPRNNNTLKATSTTADCLLVVAVARDGEFLYSDGATLLVIDDAMMILDDTQLNEIGG